MAGFTVRNRYVLLADLPLIAVAVIGAFAGRFDWQSFADRPEFRPYLITALVLKPVVFLALGMYRRYWQYASIPELVVVTVSVTTSTALMALIVLGATVTERLPLGFSRVVLLNDWALTLVLAGGLRLAIRFVHDSTIPGLGRTGSNRRTLIVGAGAAGTMVAREVFRNPQLGLMPIGFLDDDGTKIGKQISGLRVIGGTAALADVVRAQKVDHVIIAMPTARGSVVRAILDKCTAASVKSQIIPGVFELLDGQVHVNRLRNVDIVDLLRRSPVNRERITDYVAGRTVLITGAGGSIGYELARQIASNGPGHLVLLGHGENSIFEAAANLASSFPSLRITTTIADIRDERRLATIFGRVRPEIVFHAAAHKHVPLMEDNPEEAITNNIIGTRNVVREAVRSGTDRFVLISTDKAVMPTSVMGATKRVAEAIVREAARETGRAFVAVRFGNVLGSRGSVVSTFKSQIERGGPVTVTHPEMTRFFMTIPEAVHLVIHAGGLGKGGELFVLDMGAPVRIVDLAQDLIKLSGLDPDEVRIVFTGVRPGEKLHEALFDASMRTQPTDHPEILQVVGSDLGISGDLSEAIAVLDEAAARGDGVRLVEELRRVIPTCSAVPDAPRNQGTPLQ